MLPVEHNPQVSLEGLIMIDVVSTLVFWTSLITSLFLPNLAIYYDPRTFRFHYRWSHSMVSFIKAFLIVIGYAVFCYYLLFPYIEQVTRSFYASLILPYAMLAFVTFLIVMYLWFKHANTGAPHRERL